jgi:hypothetical protein
MPRNLSRVLLFLVVSLGALAAGSHPASAADFTFAWPQNGNGQWSDASNWVGGVAPSGTVGTLTFPSPGSSGNAYDLTDDVPGLTVSRLVTHNRQFFEGSPAKPLTLSSGITTDPYVGPWLKMPLVLSAPNTWSGTFKVSGGLSGAASLDVSLPAPDNGLHVGDSIEFSGASNEIGPVSITGVDSIRSGVAISSPSGSVVGDLNGMNGNPVVLNSLGFGGSDDVTLGALSTVSNVRINVGFGSGSTHRKLQVASANLDPTSRLAVGVNASGGSTPGVDYGQLTSSGPINLNGAQVYPDFFFGGTGCPQLGATYTLISTTGTLSGSAAYDQGQASCGGFDAAYCGCSYRLQYNRTGSPQTVTATIIPTPAASTGGSGGGGGSTVRAVSPPVLSGVAQVGRTLIATHGTWSPAAASYTDVWIRCSTASPVVCSPITGATAATYKLTAADLGKRVRVVENVPGGTTQVSAVSAVVTAPATTGQITTGQITTALRRIGAPPSSATVGSVLAKGATLTFNAPSAGVLSVTWYQLPAGARVTAKKRPVLVARGSRTVTKSGKVKLVVRLTSAGKRLLKATNKAKRSLKLTSKASFTPKGGKRTSRIAPFRLKR